MTLRATQAVPEGRVIVRRHTSSRDGKTWFLVEIGRGRYVKRINLSEEELHQLVQALASNGAGAYH
jgi:hypothetical protein